MKRYGNLFSKICTMDNMRLAYERATKGKKHYREVRQIKNVEEYLQDLLHQIETHNYRTSSYHVFNLYTGGKWREIYKLPMKDRIVQHAIMNIIEPIFRKSFIRDTYSSIKDRGLHDGLHRIKKAMKDVRGTAYCLKLDIKKFYPSIDKEILK